MFSQTNIIDLFKRNWKNVNKKHIDFIVKRKGGISALEGVILYLYILETKPRHVIEFSPQKGYSSIAIGLGMKDANSEQSFATFEINPRCITIAKQNIMECGLNNYVQIIQGNALVEVPKYLQKYDNCDFCFIDSNHGAKFAEEYVAKIFPLLPKNCLIGVHDIASLKRNDDGISPFKTSLLGHAGEETVIRKYLKTNKIDHCVLHAIAGGKHEGANLPVNQVLYDELMKITGIDFIKAGSDHCPQTLFFKKV
ncbi:MAG: O-methyltransferase [Candidatus Hodarchaeales archaeon]|jgi:predicted O-methyltransferase YrrM